MMIPLAILALLSLGGGYFFKVPQFLASVFPALEPGENTTLMVDFRGCGLDRYSGRVRDVCGAAGHGGFAGRRLQGLYTLVYNKYFVDELYDAAVVKPIVGGSRVLLWKGVDVGVIDGIANGIASRARDVGGVLRLLQSGNIRSYAAWVLFGSVLLIVALGMAGGVR